MLVRCREKLAFARKRRVHQRLPVRVILLAEHFAHGAAEDLLPRDAQPLGIGAIDEAEGFAAVDVSRHHRQQVGQREQPGSGEHLGRQIGWNAGRVLRRRNIRRLHAARNHAAPAPPMCHVAMIPLKMGRVE